MGHKTSHDRISNDFDKEQVVLKGEEAIFAYEFLKLLYTHNICGYYQLLCNSLLMTIVNNSNEVYRKAYGKSIDGISNIRNSLIHFFKSKDEWEKRGITVKEVNNLIHCIYHTINREISESLHDVLTTHLKIRDMLSELEKHSDCFLLSGLSIPTIVNKEFPERDDYEKLKKEFNIPNLIDGNMTIDYQNQKPNQ